MFLLTLILVTVGLIMIYSASAILAHDRYGNSYYFFARQLLWVAVGCLGMWASSRVDLEKLRALAIPGLFLALFLMVLVCIPGIGRTVGGAQRWFRLGRLCRKKRPILSKTGRLWTHTICYVLTAWYARGR